MSFGYSNVLIYGYSNSGKAVEKILLNEEVKYKIYDDKLNLNGGRYLYALNKTILSDFDLIVISPAVSIYHKNIVLAEKLGIKVVSELEFASWFVKTKMIAVTGTNGKTTTVSLINHILNASGYKSVALGNIGEPLSAITELDQTKLDYVVVEVSSFQLEATFTFRPHIGVILNIDEDHIDRHKTIENYIKTKFGLFKNCDSDVLAVLNIDDQNILQHKKEISATIFGISETNSCNGVFVHNHQIYNAYNSTPEVFCNLNDLNLKNTFLNNILAVISVCKLLQIPNENIIDGINNFNYLEHRIEFVKNVNGVDYVNDSKATNIHATQNAIKSIQGNITLLLGGQDKDLNFNEFFKSLPSKIVRVICFGEAKNKIYKIAKKNKIQNLYACDNLKTATILAYKMAMPNETVLMSPACASFDAYKSYAKRGQHFRELVSTLEHISFLNNTEQIKTNKFKFFQIFKKPSVASVDLHYQLKPDVITNIDDEKNIYYCQNEIFNWRQYEANL